MSEPGSRCLVRVSHAEVDVTGDNRGVPGAGSPSFVQRRLEQEQYRHDGIVEGRTRYAPLSSF